MTDLRFNPKLSALVLYTRQFSALIDAGISIMRCFQFLEKATKDRDLKAANSMLSERVGSGAHLSQALAERPDLFSQSYIGFVRAGEIGGVLDDALAYLADWLEQERDLAERLEIRSLLLRLASKVLGETPASEAVIRATLESAYRSARTASFCRLFEMCLTAGVPMKLALATAAGILEGPAAARLRAAAEELEPDQPVAHLLAEVEDLAPVVAAMVRTGEEHACLDDMLRNAARFYHAEAAGILHEAGQLPG